MKRNLGILTLHMYECQEIKIEQSKNNDKMEELRKPTCFQFSPLFKLFTIPISN